jgi:hypothetical protein
MAKAELDVSRMTTEALRGHLNHMLMTADHCIRLEGSSAELRGAVTHARSCWIELRLRGDQLVIPTL